MNSPMKFSIDDEAVANFLALQESQFIESPSYFRDALIERLTVGSQEFGDEMPWSKTAGCFRLRPGEVSLWAGINGHGKSMLLGQIALWLMPHSVVTIASLEMKPDATMLRLMRQASGSESPTVDYANKWIDWADGKLWIYDELDSVRTDRILAMVHHAATTLKSNHIIIDSLMKCVAGTDDYSGQKDFIDRLTRMAKKYNVHIHIVHHMRKGHSEEQIPDKFDVKGAGEITDQVDNLCIVHRNKSKERQIEKGEDVEKYIPDATLRIAKQRHGEWEGDFALWFHKQSQQYIPKPGHGAMPWPYPGATILDHTVTTSQENSSRPLGENPAGFPEFPETGIQ